MFHMKRVGGKTTAVYRYLQTLQLPPKSNSTQMILHNIFRIIELDILFFG